MHFHQRLGLTLLVLLICTSLGNVLALPQSSHHSTAISPPGISAPSSPSAPHRHRRLKRMDADLEDGWHMSIENYEVFIPLGLAAADMIRFYGDLLTQARQHASLNSPGLREFQLTLGVLKLLFTSNYVITWDFVTEFAEELVSLAIRGPLDPRQWLKRW